MSAAFLEEAVGSILTAWLVHGMWQTSVIAVTAGAALWLLRRRSARTRYVVGCCALAALVFSPSATLLMPSPAPVEAPATAPGAESAQAFEVSPAPVDPSSIPVVWGRARGPELAALAAHLPVLLVAAWLAGCCAMALRLLIGWSQARARFLLAASLAPAALRETTARVADRLGLRRGVKVLESPHAPSPLVVGVVRPVLVLPPGLGEQLTVPQLEAVLAHELSHVSRHDTLANLAQCLVEVLFFFHPAARWLSRQVRLEREHCCDDAAVQLCGSARVYSSALLGLEELRQAGPALELGAGSQPLLARVQRLLGKAQPAEPRRRVAVRAVMALGVLAASGGAWAWGGPAAAPRAGAKGVGILSASSCSRFVYPKDFSAISTYRVEGREVRNRIFVSRCGRVRLEPADGARVQTLLYDVNSQEMASLDLEERSYAIMPKRLQNSLPLHLPGGCTEASATCTLKGEEVIAGRRTQRFQRTHAPHDTVTNWVDLELGYPIREEADLFGTLKLEAIQAADLDPSLFLVPGDFRKSGSP